MITVPIWPQFNQREDVTSHCVSYFWRSPIHLSPYVLFFPFSLFQNCLELQLTCDYRIYDIVGPINISYGISYSIIMLVSTILIEVLNLSKRSPWWLVPGETDKISHQMCLSFGRRFLGLKTREKKMNPPSRVEIFKTLHRRVPI